MDTRLSTEAASCAMLTTVLSAQPITIVRLVSRHISKRKGIVNHVALKIVYDAPMTLVLSVALNTPSSILNAFFHATLIIVKAVDR